nr:elongation of very long chain fatty acids protein 1 [Daphnia magna]
MGSVAQIIVQEGSRIWEQRDKRTDGWILADSPLTPIVISLAYLLVVKTLGPKLMENRKPFQLRNILFFYNAFQIAFNGWIFCKTCQLTWFNGYSLVCEPVDYSNNEDALQLVLIGYCFYISKIIDFLDTIFFIMRKKDNQISFLHVLHHSVMPSSVWICFRFIVGGHCCFFVTLNSLVHVVMYFYYLMAAMGPRFQKYLWWKKYVTVFQMVQFVCVGFHSLQLLFVECNFPTAFSLWSVVQALLFLSLFKNFHSKAYAKNANLESNSEYSPSHSEKKLS